MLLLEGIPVSPGFANGIAVICNYEVEHRIELPIHSISQREVGAECQRIDEALEQSGQDLRAARQAALKEPQLADAAALMSAHSTMAKEIAAIVRQHIGRELVNAEVALDAVIREFVVRFERLENTYFREREQDVRDVGRRIMRNLSGAATWRPSSLPRDAVIVARELLPSETVEYAKAGAAAIVVEHGSTFSHTAIVARSLGIPAVTGIAHVTSRVQTGMRLLVDGESGRVVISPTEVDVVGFSARERAYQVQCAAMAADEQLPCVTRDGVEISLLANIGLPTEVNGVRRHNLVGVGLFRTEFLFLEAHQRPGLEAQLAFYDKMARDLDELPLVIRTFDLGGDKLPPFLLAEGLDAHASLHLRGLRFSLHEVQLLETQLAAILQIAQSADVRILFPMVIGADDFARAIAAVHDVADRLGLDHQPLIGAMLETPAALYALDEILALADFAAIGTNDLAQYMLAADRDLAEGTDDCTAAHPAVLRALKQIVEAAERRQVPVSVCGEEAGDPSFATLLVGLGIRELSLTPTRAAAVRHALRDITCADARALANLALQCQTPQQVRKLFQNSPSADVSTIYTNIRLSAPNPVTPGEAAVGAEPSRHTSDRHQTLRELNQHLKLQVAASSSQLCEANALLTAAIQDERLAAVAFETHDSILITDRGGKILRVNKSFTQMTGYTAEEVVGKSPRVLKSGRHNEQFYQEMWQAIHLHGHWQGEIWNRRKGGQLYLQRLTISCVKNELGETTHYVGDGQDLTQQKQGEADVAAIQAARRVQRTLFPPSAPQVHGFDIAGAVYPAEHVSGDFYDYIPLGQDSIGVLVADVSGHGLGPALLMARTQAHLRALAETCVGPGQLLARANQLFGTSDSGHFVTIFLGYLNVLERCFEYAGAGHQGYHISRAGAVSVLRSSSLPLGVNTTITPRATTITLETGDTLVIPTDGAEEAISVDGRQFGRERIFDLVRNNHHKSASEIVGALFRAASEFGRQPQEDDITAIVIKVLPASR